MTQLICAFEAAFIKNPRADLSVLEQVRVAVRERRVGVGLLWVRVRVLS